MKLTRRDAVLGLGAAALFPTPALAKSASRDYVITFGRNRVGKSSVSVSTKGNRVTAKYFIDTKANLLVLKYRYGLQATEVWEDGRLISLKSSSFENKRKFNVSGKAVSGGFKIEGSAFSGVVKGNPITTSYWTPEVLRRNTWISSQTGKPINVKVQKSKQVKVKTPAGVISCYSYLCKGLKRDMELFYDDRGEWVGNEVSAFGSRARFLAASLDPAMAGLFKT